MRLKNLLAFRHFSGIADRMLWVEGGLEEDEYKAYVVDNLIDVVDGYLFYWWKK